MYLDLSPLPSFNLASMRYFAPGERHVTRVANASVLLLVYSGVLRFYEDGVPVEVSEGEYYIQREGLYQEGIDPSDSPVYFYIHFDGKFSEDSSGIALSGLFDREVMQSYIDSFERHYKKHTATPLITSSILLRVLDELQKYRPQRSIDEKNIAETVAMLIREEYSTKLGLDSIAAKYHYSENYIIKIFSTHYGMTPHKYLCQVRVENAKRLISAGKLSLSEIARAVGFRDFSTFYRNFSSVAGCSPSEWKYHENIEK